jgi:hypothetical protein
MILPPLLASPLFIVLFKWTCLLSLGWVVRNQGHIMSAIVFSPCSVRIRVWLIFAYA